MSGITDCTAADIFNYMEKVNEKHTCTHARNIALRIWILSHIAVRQQKKIIIMIKNFLHCSTVGEDPSPCVTWTF